MDSGTIPAETATGRITVSVRLFAELRERAGAERLRLWLPAGARAGDVWAALPPPLAGAEPPSGLRLAVDHSWSAPDAPLEDGCEVALLLPGSGG